MDVRPASTQDWVQIWPFFRDIVLDGETYAYPDDLTAERAPQLWAPGPGATTVVAVDGATVIGVATVGPNRPGRGSHVATASLKVSPTASGPLEDQPTAVVLVNVDVQARGRTERREVVERHRADVAVRLVRLGLEGYRDDHSLTRQAQRLGHDPRSVLLVEVFQEVDD